MKFHLMFAVLLFFIACNVQAIVINEIMPNPDDECGDCSEWIEIFNPGNTELNLSGWLIGDEKSNDSLFSETSMITNSTYFLIIGENANISNITENNVIYFRTDGKIGSGLNNNGGDNVSIHNSTGIVDYVSYHSFPDSKEGYSWARMDNGSWFYSDSPTPGEPNSFTNTSGNQTTTNNTCDLRMWIKCDEIFVADSSNKYYPMVEDLEGGDFEPEVEYWIEDLFGNIARSKFRTNNTNVAKSWTPPEITGTEAYAIHAMITNEVCNDTNLSNNAAEKLIVVKGEEPSSESECSCETEIIEIEKPCSCGYAPKKNVSEKEEYFEIISYPEETSKDSEIEIKINLENPSLDKKNYTIYSYVYEGNKPVSLGFDGNDWVNRWNANSQNVTISGNSSLNLTLKNRIAGDTNPGKYKLRVRMWLDDKKHDITRDLLIKEPAEPANQTINQTVEEENKTEYNETESDEPESEIHTPTGRVISKEENWFSILIESVINFFKNLFSL